LLSAPNASLGTFSSRIEACYSLALIDKFEYQEIGLIRKIRNEFAHAKHGISFESVKIKGLCTSLQSPLPDGGDYPVDTPRFRLVNAIVCIALRLYYRPNGWLKKDWSLEAGFRIRVGITQMKILHPKTLGLWVSYHLRVKSKHHNQTLHADPFCYARLCSRCAPFYTNALRKMGR
jgi:hypothetical protein